MSEKEYSDGYYAAKCGARRYIVLREKGMFFFAGDCCGKDEENFEILCGPFTAEDVKEPINGLAGKN